MKTAPPKPLPLLARVILGKDDADKIEADAFREYEERLAADAVVVSAGALAAAVSRSADVPYADAWDHMLSIPDNLLHLFATPEGWATIGAHVAIQCGRGPVVVRPSVH
jgi:hypothetical protein